ncbi:hypothetical protein B0T14DRAFT_505632 [Immersiella caudata]|uniref:Uncharacterized protein n=1 Tax=Immersiella caudata TaxID=314043 RepID=A0AA40CD24_9PEZI|nr:hypothetical protein B0T14DRAFT_505632 [Immersiella caudata]
MNHGIPNSTSSLDTTWRAPDLPPSMFGNGYGHNAPPRRRRAKFIFITEEEDGGDEDDVLLGSSTPVPDRAGAGRTEAATSVPPENSVEELSGHSKNSGADATAQPEPRVIQKAVRVRYKIPEILVRDSLKHEKKKRRRGPNIKASNTPKGTNKAPATKTKGDTGTQILMATSKASTSGLEVRSNVNTSFPEGRLATNPSTQTFQVEILAMAPADISTYMIISPEASPEPETSQPAVLDQNEDAPPDVMVLDEMPSTSIPEESTGVLKPVAMSDISSNQKGQQDQNLPSDQAAGGTAEKGESHVNPPSEVDDQPQSAQAEVFSRNVQDPSYAFSDEDEPTIPRWQPHQRADGPKEVAIITHSEAFSGPTISDFVVSSPTTTPSRDSSRPTESFEVLSPVTQTTEPPMEPVEPCHGEQTITATVSPPHTTPQSVERETPATVSLLSVKPRRSGIRRSLMSPDDPTIIQPILASVERASDIENVLFDPPALRKRKRRSSQKIQDEPALPTSEDISYNRVIPETPEPSPGPKARRRPREPSPDLGMSPSKGDFSPANEGIAPQETIDDESPNGPRKHHSPKRTISPHPQTPSQKALRRLFRPTGNSSAKNSILSLISDDEDELSLDPSDFTPSGSRRPKPKPKPTPATHKSLSRVRTYLSSSAPSSARSTKSTLTRRGAILGATASASARTPPSKGRYGAGLVSKLSLANVSKLTIRSGPTAGGPGSLMRASAAGVPPSPVSRLGSELIQTPGGHVRRCGEGDFRCDRDFCFVCL